MCYRGRCEAQSEEQQRAGVGHRRRCQVSRVEQREEIERQSRKRQFRTNQFSGLLGICPVRSWQEIDSKWPGAVRALRRQWHLRGVRIWPLTVGPLNFPWVGPFLLRGNSLTRPCVCYCLEKWDRISRDAVCSELIQTPSRLSAPMSCISISTVLGCGGLAFTINFDHSETSV